jgi:hypothetical protein
MRRVACILTVLGILCVAAGQAQANGGRHGGYYGGYYGGYHGGGHYGGYCRDTVVVRPPFFATPRFVVPLPPPQTVYPAVVYPPYSPVYPYRYYAPVPRAGFYYQGRGLSLGVGW